ncbi:MAG: hypothetical protein ACYSSI_03375 [Planctomycetota bacterium]
MMLWLWCSENSKVKDGETGNVPHCRCSRTQNCGFAAARTRAG